MDGHNLRSSTGRKAPSTPLVENDMSRLPMAMPPALGESAQTRRGAARPTTAPTGGGSHHITNNLGQTKNKHKYANIKGCKIMNVQHLL